VARGRADRRRAERVGRPAALVGAGAVALHLPVQAAAVSGYGVLEVLTDASVLGATLTSGFGQSWLARLAALLALAVPWFVADRA
jgi:putative copper export protein